MNFLDLFNQTQKMLILSELENKNQHRETVKDYLIVKIHLDFAKKRRIIKENLKIKFGNITKMELKDKVYYFTINNEDVKRISDLCYKIKGLNNNNKLQKILNKETGKILNNIYPN